MLYQNKRNGQVAKLVSQNDKFKTVTLEKQDGDTFDITVSTFKRWWKQAEENTVEESVQELATEVPEISQEELDEIKQASEDFAGDDTPYPQVMQEIIEGAKAKSKKASKKVKKEKAPKVPKQADPAVTEVKQFIETTVQGMKNCELFTTPKAPNVVVFKVDGHMFGRMNTSKKVITLCLRSAAVAEVRKPDKVLNHMFNAGYVATDLDKKSIVALLEAAKDQQVAKKAQVKTKAKKSKKVGKEEE